MVVSTLVERLPLPSNAALVELSDKYRTLAGLRRAKRRGEPDPARSVFQQLARRFPGALNELETLTLAELDERAELLSRAADEGNPAAWMRWLWTYHALIRGALALKRGVDISGAEQEAAMPLSKDFVAPDREPWPLAARVFAEISRLAGDVGADEIADALFPRRRVARVRTGAVLAPDQDVE